MQTFVLGGNCAAALSATAVGSDKAAQEKHLGKHATKNTSDIPGATYVGSVTCKN
jgi:hypothetical protein